MRKQLGPAIAAMAIALILAGDAAVAQPATQTPAQPQAPVETRTPAAAPRLTGTGGLSAPPHAAYSVDSDDLDTPAIGARSYRMACRVSVGTCLIAADRPGRSCHCDATGRPSQYQGTTVAP